MSINNLTENFLSKAFYVLLIVNLLNNLKRKQKDCDKTWVHEKSSRLLSAHPSTATTKSKLNSCKMKKKV